MQIVDIQKFYKDFYQNNQSNIAKITLINDSSSKNLPNFGTKINFNKNSSNSSINENKRMKKLKKDDKDLISNLSSQMNTLI